MIREHFIPMGRPTLRDDLLEPFFQISQPAASKLQALLLLCWSLLNLDSLFEKKIVQKDWKAAFMIEKTSRDGWILNDQIKKKVF